MATFDPESFRRAMERAPDRLAAVFLPMLLRRARAFRQGVLVRNRLSGRPGLARRSGDLARSFRADPEGDVSAAKLDGFTLTEFSVSPYVWPHEAGATIAAKNARNLAIPIGDNKTAAGVKRAAPRTFANTFVRTSKAGNRIMFQRLPGGKVRALFLLRKSVAIPARLGFFAEWAKDQERRQGDLAKAVAQVLGGLA